MSTTALCDELHEAGSALEAAAVMSPGSAIKIDPLKLARLLMRARATIREIQTAAHLPPQPAIPSGDTMP